MASIVVTWQLAGVVIALIVGIPCLCLIGTFLASHDPSPAVPCAIIGGLAGLSFIWGGLGIRSRYRALPPGHARSSFLIRLAVGTILILLGAGGGTLGVDNEGLAREIFSSLAMGFAGSSIVVVGRAMTLEY